MIGEAGLLDRYMVLRILLDTFDEINDEKDDMVCSLDLEKGYSVASCYSRYALMCIPFGPPNRGDEAFELIWKMEVLFKIKAFGWRLFMNRLPTKYLLVYKGINLTSSNLNCVL